MPSAATKIEKTVSPETMVMDPVKQIIGIVDKKVRNLEKRKLRLDTYRSKTEKGEQLLDDQLEAVRHYDEVVQNLGLAYELQKQFAAVTNEAEKCLRKQMKRDKLERQGVESERIRELLQLQGLLDSMGSPSARDDFLNGTNGAVTLSEESLEQLDELYKLISPARDADTSYPEQLDSARDHIISYLESRDKEVAGTTYLALHELVVSINQCGYFDNLPVPSEGAEEEEGEGEEEGEETAEEVVECSAAPAVAEFSEAADDLAMVDAGQEAVMFAESQESVERLVEPMTRLAEPSVEPVSTHNIHPHHSHAADPSPRLAFPPSTQPPQPSSHPAPTSINPTTGTAYDEELFFSTCDGPSQFSGPRQLQDIVSSVRGSFDFLQESQIELEPARIDPAVVAAHQMAPSSIAMSHTGFSASPLLSSEDPAVAQYSVSQSVESVDPQQQGYDHGFGVLQQQGFAQQQMTTSSASDVPQPIPLPSEALASQQVYENQAMMAQDDQDKKPFAMNPNANIFRSMYSEQEAAMAEHGNDGRSFSQLLHSQPDYQGSSGFAGSTYTRGGGSNGNAAGRGARNNRGGARPNVAYPRGGGGGGGGRGGFNQPRGGGGGGNTARDAGFGNGARNAGNRSAPRGGGGANSGGRGGRGNSNTNRGGGGYNRMASGGGAPLQV